LRVVARENQIGLATLDLAQIRPKERDDGANLARAMEEIDPPGLVTTAVVQLGTGRVSDAADSPPETLKDLGRCRKWAALRDGYPRIEPST
jgi:hypothetical protein